VFHVQKGINQWCFPGSFSVAECISLAQEAGFATLELNVGEPPSAKGTGGTIIESLGLSDSAGLTTETAAATAQEIAQQARNAGLELPSLSTGLHWQYPLTSSDKEIRDKGASIVVKMLELAATVGADTVLVVPGVVDATTSYRQAWDRSLAVLRDLAGEAAKRRVHIGIENVWNKFLLSPLEFAHFVDEVNSDWVGAYFDVGNVLISGYPEQWILELGERIRKIHVKDFRYDIGNIRGFVPLLQGDVPWKRAIEALREIGYSGPVTAEVSPYPGSPDQLIFDTSRALDTILAAE
jgi:L-ribulose-5-phosphate 3-epimerase